MTSKVSRLFLAAIAFWVVAFHACASDSFEALLQRAEVVRSAQPQEFQTLVDELNSKSARASAAQRQQLAYLNAYRASFAGNYEEGLRLARPLLASDDLNTRFRAGALIVNTNAALGRFEEGLRQLSQTLSLLNRISDPLLRQHGMMVAATMYDQIGQYRLALHYADRILAEPAPARTQCFAGQYRLEALQNLNELPATDAPIVAVINQCLRQHELVVANYLRGTLARKWAQQGKGDKALAMLTAHMDEITSTRYPRVVAEIDALMAELLFAKGDLAEAELHAKRVAAVSASIPDTQPLASAYKTLYSIAEARHDPVTALAYYRSFARADKAFLSVIKARELAYQIVRQEGVEKNQQIQLLNRQNTLLQLQQRVEQQKAENSRLLMMLFAVFALIIAYWGYKTRRLHASLRRMAETDALTGICNRHHFTAQSEKTLAQCAKSGEQVSLIMFDLDHFKVVNDSYGHVAGDWVLKEVAKTCSELCRRMDHFGRLGGEEFAILLQGCDARAATRIADDCRMRILRIQSAPSGHAFKLAASFGVSCAKSSGYDLDKLISHADQMLYRAKREGRNRVKTYTHDVPMEMREPAPTSGAGPIVDGPAPHAKRRGKLNA